MASLSTLLHSRRHVKQPGGGRRCRLHFERLETRWALSHDVIAGFGVAGDSLSDEYEVENYNYARNWVELLAEERHFDLGQELDWGEPRREGYEFNWARSGATSATLLSTGQHTGLAGLMLRPKLDDPSRRTICDSSQRGVSIKKGPPGRSFVEVR